MYSFRTPEGSIGLHIGPSEAEPFWISFLRHLVRRGLTGVKLVISDAHALLSGLNSGPLERQLVLALRFVGRHLQSAELFPPQSTTSSPMKDPCANAYFMQSLDDVVKFVYFYTTYSSMIYSFIQRKIL